MLVVVLQVPHVFLQLLSKSSIAYCGSVQSALVYIAHEVLSSSPLHVTGVVVVVAVPTPTAVALY